MEESYKYKLLKTNIKLAIKFSKKIYGIKKDCLRKSLELPHGYRSDFSRDRDRILYSKSFRRLSGKTQVFISSYDPHIRTRLIHTMEVNQISKTIADCFKFDNNLCEAMAFGHDVGHAPFGHMGEKILNAIMNNCNVLNPDTIKLKPNQRGFKHNLQSARLLNELENTPYPNNGLNLTFFTLWGILKHSKMEWEKKCKLINAQGRCTITEGLQECNNKNNLLVGFYDGYYADEIKKSWSFEGLIVGWADEIAQRHHDIEDGFIAKTIDPDWVFKKLKDIFDGKYFEANESKIYLVQKELEKPEPDLSVINTLYSSIIVDLYVTKYKEDLEKYLGAIIDSIGIDKEEDFWKKRSDIIEDSDFKKILNYEDNFKEDKKFKEILQDRIIDSENVQIMNKRGVFILRKLFKAYFSNPLQLPDDIIVNVFRCETDSYKKIETNEEILGKKRSELKKRHKDCELDLLVALARAICDYLANMTDEYALAQYNKLYGSTSMRNF